MEKKERNELKNRFIDNGWSYKFEEYQDGDISQFELEEFFLDFVDQELDKAREEGGKRQAELDRALYSVSFEHIKNADFEKILLEAVDKAREEGARDVLGLLKGIDNTLELQVLVLGLERKLKGEDAGLAYDTLIHKLTKLSNK